MINVWFSGETKGSRGYNKERELRKQERKQNKQLPHTTLRIEHTGSETGRKLRTLSYRGWLKRRATLMNWNLKVPSQDLPERVYGDPHEQKKQRCVCNSLSSTCGIRFSHGPMLSAGRKWAPELKTMQAFFLAVFPTAFVRKLASILWVGMNFRTINLILISQWMKWCWRSSSFFL